MDFCEPHQDRGFYVAAAKDVAGTPMCEACFSGRPVSLEELTGELSDSRAMGTYRRYYEANREKVLETHRRWREAKSGSQVACQTGYLGARERMRLNGDIVDAIALLGEACAPGAYGLL